ncbi:MAG: single-stranded DNA-binding protein [Clostridiales bacterium]|nr:single-stranded DNA-binding protein [Clostridiales bacterium]
MAVYVNFVSGLTELRRDPVLQTTPQGEPLATHLSIKVDKHHLKARLLAKEGGTDFVQQVARNLRGGHHIWLEGSLSVNPYEVQVVTREDAQHCPYCNAPIDQTNEEGVLGRRRYVRCQQCKRPFFVAVRTSYWTLRASRVLKFPQGPTNRYPAGSMYEFRVFLMGLLAGNPQVQTTPEGLRQVIFPLAVHYKPVIQPDGTKFKRHSDVVPVYVNPQNGNDSLARSILVLGPGSPVVVEGRLMAEYRAWGNVPPKHAYHFCPRCGTPVNQQTYPAYTLGKTTTDIRWVCESCGLEVWLARRVSQFYVEARDVHYIGRYPMDIWERWVERGAEWEAVRNEDLQEV